MEENIKIELTYPIVTRDGEEREISCKEIYIGRFKVKHLKLLPKDFMNKSKKGEIDPSLLCPLIAGLSNLTDKEVGEIDIVDLEKIIGVLEDFFGSTLETGKQ